IIFLSSPIIILFVVQEIEIKKMNLRLSLLLIFFLVKSNQGSIFKTFSGVLSPNSHPSSVVFPLSGNILFGLSSNRESSKSLSIGIDTSSDLTWVQCNAPCKGCTVIHSSFKNKLFCAYSHLYFLLHLYMLKGNIVPCSDPICSSLHWPKKPECPNPKEQCDYEVTYADQGSSMGALVIDQFSLKLQHGSFLQPRLAFGCGYDQSFPSAHPPPATAGVLGLGRGRISVLTQLVSAGLTRNVIGHCLSSNGGGFLFFGDNLIPSTGVSWTPLMSQDNHYTTGPAELLFNGKSTGLKDLKLIFDSGSSYTYFNSKTYQKIVNLKTGNVCLGILNGSEVGLQDSNVIGGVMMIYDNEKQQLGWVSADCNKIPKI
ncbi:unnamed protein product, partial [Thlaspi arvense]